MNVKIYSILLSKNNTLSYLFRQIVEFDIE